MRNNVSTIAGMFMLSATLLVGAEPSAPRVKLLRHEEWTSVFGEQQVKQRLAVEAERMLHGRVVWNLSTAEGISLMRGEVACDGKTPVELEWNVPAVKPGVVMSTRFTASLVVEGERAPAASYESAIRIFPRDPFYDRREWLKNLSVKLYDPPGATAKVFTAMDLPHERITNIAVIGDLNQGLLILGEGISFREERALWDRVLQAASRGVAILCLAPAAGELALPPPGNDAGQLAGLGFARSGFVSRLDPRLDERHWMSTPADAKFSFVPTGRGERVAVDVQSGPSGWCWIDMCFAPVAAPEKKQPATSPHGVVVALPLIEHWEAGPTPRFLLASLLTELLQNVTSTPKRP